MLKFMIKKLFSLFQEIKFFSLPLHGKEIHYLSFLKYIISSFIYFFLFLLAFNYIINENIFVFLTGSLLSGILYYYLSSIIKYSNNKFFRILQDFLLIFFIMLLVSTIYMILISIDYTSFINIINLDGSDVDNLSNEVSNNISNKKFSVDLKKENDVEVYTISVEKSILDKIGKLGEGLISTFMNGFINQLGPAAAGGTIGAKALQITSAANLP